MDLPSSPDFERTVKAAESGDAQAMLRAADYYYQGDLVKKNYKKAVQWYRRAAEQGLPKAEFGLGLCYASGHGEKLDHLEAVKWYRKAAEKGHTEATWKLAECYRHGTGVQKDEAEAVRWYRKAAEAGHDRAQCTLGYQIEHGQGVEKNMTEAIEWYRRAGENGNATAQLNLALCYDNGRGVTADANQAFAWFLKAADRGNVRAQHRVGLAYETGRGVGKDITQALQWYHKAADNDSGESWNRIGRIYDYGDGVTQDQVEAIRCYKLASDLGHAPAAAAVAYAHEQGQAVGKDLAQAARWYRKGAEGGDLKCLLKLAEFYEFGKGMKAEPAEALKWYIKAAEKGSEEALQWLHTARQVPAHLRDAEKAMLEKKDTAAAPASKAPPSPPVPVASAATPVTSAPTPPTTPVATVAPAAANSASAPAPSTMTKAERKKANAMAAAAAAAAAASQQQAAAAAAQTNGAANGSARAPLGSTPPAASTPPLPPATAAAAATTTTKGPASLMRTYDESVVYQLVALLPTASQVPLDKAAQAMIHILMSRIDRASNLIPELEPVESLLTPADLQHVLASNQEQLQAFFYGLMEDVTMPNMSWVALVERVAQRLGGLRAIIDGELGPRIKSAAEFLRLMHCATCERLLVPPVFQCDLGHVLCGACRSLNVPVCGVCRADVSKATRNVLVENFSKLFPVPCPHCGAVLPYGSSFYHEKQCPMRPFACPENWQLANGWLGSWPGDAEACPWSGAPSEVVNHCLTQHAMPLLPSDPLAVEFDVAGPPPFTDAWQWRGAAVAGRLFVCCLVRQPDGSARCFGVKASEERREGEMYKIAFTVGSHDELAVIGCSLPLYSTRAAPRGSETDFEISQRMLKRFAPDGKLRVLFRFNGVAAQK